MEVGAGRPRDSWLGLVESLSFEHSPRVLAFKGCGVGMDMMLITLLIFTFHKSLSQNIGQILLYFSFEEICFISGLVEESF